MSFVPSLKNVASNLLAITASLGDVFRLAHRVQYGALIYRGEGDSLKFLLVTSLDTGRWIIPKGWPRKDGQAHASVFEEAWEEAGIRGDIAGEAIGTYSYRKAMEGGYEVDCDVTVYPVAFTSADGRFPEAGRRTLAWVSPAEAARRVHEPELREILLNWRP